MNIIVTKENLPDKAVMGYCDATAMIYVDSTLDPHTQRETAIHEVLEAYLPIFSHQTIEDLTDAITDALDQLEEA